MSEDRAKDKKKHRHVHHSSRERLHGSGKKFRILPAKVYGETREAFRSSVDTLMRDSASAPSLEEEHVARTVSSSPMTEQRGRV